MAKSDGKQESPGQPPQGKPTPLNEQDHPRPRGYDWIREQAEALIVAVILALTIRHFAVEAFEIPTGSMANMLYGIHSWLSCPNCGTDFNAALRSDSVTGNVSVAYGEMLVYEGRCPTAGCRLALHSRRAAPQRPDEQSSSLRSPTDPVFCTSCGQSFQGKREAFRKAVATRKVARCPICHHRYEAVLEKSNYTGGHKILVDKFAYLRGAPRRWDVIVFGFDQWKNYIKRLIGLPGERVQVWDGDVYINGKLERKSDHAYVQDALWTKISDSDVAEGGLARTPAWSELAVSGGRTIVNEKNARWTAASLKWSLNASGDLAVLDYRRGFDNYYNYNLIEQGIGGVPARIQVGDKKVSFVARAAAAAPRSGASGQDEWTGSWVGAEIRDGDFTFRLRLPVGKASEENPLVLERVQLPGANAAALRVTRVASIPLATDATISLSNADDRVIATLDGVEVARLDYESLPAGADLNSPPPTPGERVDAHHVRLIACGAQVELGSIKVYRDMYYIAERNFMAWHGIQLGEGEYFAMGDNSPSSSDGRTWGSIPAGNMMGRALLVFWPAWPINFQCKLIR